MPIQIPIEIGDVILTGKFKNHKVTVKEIGLDDHQLPTVNGKGIMKIRIEKLMKPKQPVKEANESDDDLIQNVIDTYNHTKSGKMSLGGKREAAKYQRASEKTGFITVYSSGYNEYSVSMTEKGINHFNLKRKNENQESNMKNKKTLKEMMDADDSYPVPKKPLVQSEKNPGKFAATVKIKKEDDRFWFYMQNANGTEANITNVGFETIEQARHAARMKAFTIIDDKDDKEEDSFNKRPESATDPVKPTKREPLKGAEKPEEMKLSKEKELKMEILRIAKKVIREAFTSHEISNALKKLEQNTPPDQEQFKRTIWKSNISVLKSIFDKLQSKSAHGQRQLSDVDIWRTKYVRWYIQKKQIKEELSKKKNELNELEVSDPELIAKIEEMARLSDQMDKLKNEMEKLKEQFEPLDDEITKLMDEAAATGDRAIETKTILITIKKKGYTSDSVSWKEFYTVFYPKLNGKMRNQADVLLKSHTKIKTVGTSLAVQYKKTEVNEGTLSNFLNKIKSYFSNIFNKLKNNGQSIDSDIEKMKTLIG